MEQTLAELAETSSGRLSTGQAKPSASLTVASSLGTLSLAPRALGAKGSFWFLAPAFRFPDTLRERAPRKG